MMLPLAISQQGARATEEECGGGARGEEVLQGSSIWSLAPTGCATNVGGDVIGELGLLRRGEDMPAL